jgi:opacity protein-like surface antigen
VGPPRTVVRGNYVGSVTGSAGYDVAPDGRFLMLKGVGSEGAKGEAATHRIVMVRHWTGELEQRVPRASR